MPHYVLSACDNMIKRSDKTDFFKPAEVVSSHTSPETARSRKDKLNKQSSSLNGFTIIETSLKLTKGETYPEELALAQEQERELEAINLLCGLWENGLQVTDQRKQRYSSHLAALELTYEDLVGKYGDKARAALDRQVEERQAQAGRMARIHAVGEELTQAAQEHTYSFPAVRGVQAGKEFYMAQIPYGVLVKLFVFDEEESVPPELRAQRSLSEKRAREISQYVLGNETSYVLPALTATVSKEMRFDAMAVSGSSDRLGMLNIPMTATLLINDGQHRRRGIELALAERARLSHETIAVTIFFDEGLERSQQIFSDINAKQVKPSSAINALYNKRDPFNAWIVSLLDEMPQVKSRIDFENATVSAGSHKLWSLVGFKKAIATLVGVSMKSPPYPEELARCGEFVKAFFDQCSQTIPEWRAMMESSISAKAVRQDYVIGHTVWLDALATFTNHAVLNNGTPIGLRLDELKWSGFDKLQGIHALKSAAMWQGRCVSLGKMQRTADGMKLTSVVFFELAGLALPRDIGEAEERFQANANSQ
ncbi:DNA sulfur modification protein DndB [Halomonas sp. 3A7M]|uniref:DNA sulfur modification protein DndB n=1 Tax=Halomonas sp. 3A7M TaxID=2742616 RepID=UPI001866FAA6|nr:DNA sulfur modification protein DndB [Halomonas sp. 3A7M]